MILLFAEFAAMGIIAEIDNIAFWYVESGFVGESIRNDAHKVKNVKVNDQTMRVGGLFSFLRLRTVIFLMLLVIMISSFTFVAHRQSSGFYLNLKYPACGIALEDLRQLGDGECNGGFFNSFQCGFDDGVSEISIFSDSYPFFPSLTIYIISIKNHSINKGL